MLLSSYKSYLWSPYNFDKIAKRKGTRTFDSSRRYNEQMWRKPFFGNCLEATLPWEFVRKQYRIFYGKGDCRHSVWDSFCKLENIHKFWQAINNENKHLNLSQMWVERRIIFSEKKLIARCRSIRHFYGDFRCMYSIISGGKYNLYLWLRDTWFMWLGQAILTIFFHS